MPHDPAPDSSLSLLREGYSFLPRRFERYQSDIFGARLLGRQAICMRGADAGHLFYDTTRFERSGAVPGFVLKTVFGEGGVQGLDDAAHRHRKAMFMAVMTPESIDDLVARTTSLWRAALPKWESRGRMVLFDEAAQVLCQAGCDWAGVALPAGDRRRRAEDLIAAVDGFGALGWRHWRGRLGRRRSEAWLEDVVADVRAGRLETPDDRALHIVAFHRDHDGELLSERTAAVELLNMVRPFVAVSWFIAFMALAMHDHPGWKARLRTGDDADADMFVHEVRRFYPFAPMLGARVREDFDWNGHHFQRGTLVILDVFGTHRDGRMWPSPGEFVPDRFRDRDPEGFDFIPQGGGDPDLGHRCAGEHLTIATMRKIARILSAEMTYQVPDQDLRLSLRRMPAKPPSGIELEHVRQTRPAM
ncbi:cytochrome P450 [Phytoactinopolyspora alkaliphila]|uniref:Cytochrome P450 n=2 Tax=Phytoactinopolyspora alkaliphila TaxID=1783498 RepID=A0A6N9YJZ6_9ACTN|nr:cytochrome P450 [Phytoactinopolyspora alkaliphila]